MKIKELREKNLEELIKLAVDKKDYARKLRFDMVSKQVKDVKEYKNTKKDIARILTLISEAK